MNSAEHPSAETTSDWRLSIALTTAILLMLCSCGLAESTFDLAHESPLPRWCKDNKGREPPDASRAQVTVSYYVGEGGRYAVLHCAGSEVKLKLIGLDPIITRQEPGKPTPYSSFEILTLGDDSEVVGHISGTNRFSVIVDSDLLRNIGKIVPGSGL